MKKHTPPIVQYITCERYLKFSESYSHFHIFALSHHAGLSPPSSQSAAAPWDQKPPPSHWNGQPMGSNVPQIDHKPPQMPPQTHVPPHQHPQMGGYMPQYWYQPETNPSLLT